MAPNSQQDSGNRTQLSATDVSDSPAETVSNLEIMLTGRGKIWMLTPTCTAVNLPSKWNYFRMARPLGLLSVARRLHSQARKFRTPSYLAKLDYRRRASPIRSCTARRNAPYASGTAL